MPVKSEPDRLMVRRERALGACGLAMLLALGAFGPAIAQQQLPPPQPPAGQPPAAKAPQQKAAPGTKQPGPAPQAGPGEGQLRQRVEQLEEQLVDLQVVIGTLESLARSGGGAPPPPSRGPAGPALSSGDGPRVEALETQIRALTMQIERLAEQVRQLEERRGGAYQSPPQREGGPPPPPRVGRVEPPPQGRFGDVTVNPENENREDPIGRMIGRQPPPDGPPAPPPTGSSPANAKQAYEAAYAMLLQQDYQGAEGAFGEFLRRFPNDPLAANAQFWLGEVYFVRAQYRQSANAFLKSYQNYGNSPKAPDSLLKLAMSLDRLGQKDAACSTYQELGTKFPNAPAHVRSRAQAERARVGCP